ncbi:MAG TPA: hypothetical protein VMP08_18300, partial [Anaerolineae bacterium]|nr:hypothetical protein [Anaerolineae bacterium]
MNQQPDETRQSVNWGGRVIRLVLALVLVLSLLPAASAPLKVQAIQPLLLEMAAQRPEQTVSVIVQKTAKDASVEAAVTALGGTVTKDLHIINAFAAEMKAKDVAQLAQANGVRWVSLDAPVQQSDVTDVFTSWAIMTGTMASMGFTNAAAMFDSAIGPNGTYGYGSNVTGAFGGFVAEVTPGNAITKVELILHGYAATSFSQPVNLSIYVSGTLVSQLTASGSIFNDVVG